MTEFKIEITGLEKDISREEARRAYHGTSFSPEKRGDCTVDSYIATMEKLAAFIAGNAKDDKQKEIAQGVFDNLRERYKNKTLACVHAQSRCLSPMITGPANFPTRRNEKANAAERKRSNEWLEFHDNLEKYALKNLQACYTSGEKQDSELEEYRKKVEATEQLQATMKLVNKLHKAYLKKPDTDLSVLSESMQKLVKNYKPQYSWIPHPFAPYQLTNNNANLKRMRARLKELEFKEEQRADGGNKTFEYQGLQLVQNFDEDRLQLIFHDKPEDAARRELKSHGFKWSPRFNAWQRKLTNNAMYSVRLLASKEDLKELFQKAA